MSKLARGNVYGGVNPEYMRAQGFPYVGGHSTRPLWGTNQQTVPFLKSPAMIRREIVREPIKIAPDPLVNLASRFGTLFEKLFRRRKGV